MNSFQEYYFEHFNADLNKFFGSIPDSSKFHEDSERKNIRSIQYERLSLDLKHLEFLSDGQAKENFGVALFFIVLVDEVFYTYFKQDYQSFQQVTLFPKFIGNCPGGCRYHLHPKEILLAINYSRKGKLGEINFYESFKLAQPVFYKWIESFLQLNFPFINRIDFWNKCLRECPYQ